MLSARAVLGEALAAHAGWTGRWRAMAGDWTILVLTAAGRNAVSHDGFRANEGKGGTPSPLMGVFPLDGSLDRAIADATLDYYLNRSDDYIGSPMLSCALWRVGGAAGQPGTRLAASGRRLWPLHHRPFPADSGIPA